ncbi:MULTISPECIES: hypothetical protein [unclassified Acinetobacter]|uniref:hypothetical protein n=1 Tax=unclassified Acinetobacter TaxID=196816 RepID=UPI00244B9666|nr:MULTISPECIES: hypothetical protein [unclassified Acinetobacter]MDH0031226.1 hypothetical protein [Acinetobacter sp. GD04021]MDH0886971.1 hypothetical protein [Acinetobacter sp. GD03873]MDH1083422.1 hypothetical protein [Acinetobacter sp. GD03983]MDH2190287.1 hypothetical protein [Acinetobacter sp. GD03645]MDH2203770.1 hypothetical protein [Acinetobacter sp. GD03647]
MTKKYAPIYPHDPIVEIFENIYLLRGSVRLGLGLSMNRNMMILKQGNELTLINAVRISEPELKKLESLGQVRHIIRLGDFHGLDDQFYIDRYQATFWSQSHHVNYPKLIPQQIIQADTQPPIKNSEFFIFEQATCPEAILFIKDKKLLISTDSIQYWNDWKYFSFLSKIIIYLMGFRLGLFIGGPWLKRVTPKQGSLKSDFDRLLQLDFQHLISAHGVLLQDSAKDKLTSLINNSNI